jgi:hypothetical protein
MKVNFSTQFTFPQKLSHAQSVGSFWFYSHALNARCEEKTSPPRFFGSLMIFSSGVWFQLLSSTPFGKLCRECIF